jgi:hypothetical protein
MPALAARILYQGLVVEPCRCDSLVLSLDPSSNASPGSWGRRGVDQGEPLVKQRLGEVSCDRQALETSSNRPTCSSE